MGRPGVQLRDPGAQPSWANAATCWPGGHFHAWGSGSRRGLEPQEWGGLLPPVPEQTAAAIGTHMSRASAPQGFVIVQSGRLP